MDKKSKNTLIVSIIALSLVLIGVTYAYFSARITGLESASIIRLTSGRMGIIYSEDDASVTANNIYPREEEWITKTITLTGTNTTDQEMKYELGLNITSNTFKGGQLTFGLTGVGTNGTKIADITSKSITGQNRFFKFGTGSFINADGATHVYTLKIYFKDNGKNQNFNQEAVFNAKVSVREYGSTIATANQNHKGKHCYTNDYVANQTPATGTEYVNGQYTYKYNYFKSMSSWLQENSQNGWGAVLTDRTSTDPVTTEFCAYINEKPVTKTSYMFYYSAATSIDLSSFDTSNVTDMSGMFHSASTTSLDLSSFDTSNVTNMNSMFSFSSVRNLDLSSFDTSNLTNMSYMFYYSASTNLDLSLFDTSKVTNMEGLFYSSSATSIDLSSFDTSNAVSMSEMFRRSSVANLNLSHFDTSKVADMSWMFSENPATSLDLSSFNTSNVTNMYGMFYQSRATSIDLSSFDTSKVTTMYQMFYQSRATILDLSSFDTSSVTSMNQMFSGAYATTGYARTQTDADRFNNVAGSLPNGNNPDTQIPNTLHFAVR